MTFPPDYTVRVSARCKRVNLRMLPGRGLEVVLPVHVDPACVPELVERNRAWIEKTRARLAGQASDIPGSQVSEGVPEGFFIRGGLEYVLVRPHRFLPVSPVPPVPPVPEEESGDSGREDVHVPVHHLVLPATLHPRLAPQSVLAWLREWVRKEAYRHCLPMLNELAAAHGFSFSGARVRLQRGRWGSCSSRGSISLNGSLLFLPDVLVRHVLLHELCHTREMNHSERFWKLLFAAEPDALERDRELRGAWRHVPGWITDRTG